MKKTKKIVALFLAAVMLVCTTVAATVAYLTSVTEVVENTFTVGNVKITLDEAKVNEKGLKDNSTSTRVTDNSYHVYPGMTYDKDPQVHVKPESEEAYIRMLVTVDSVNDLKAAFPATDKDGKATEYATWYNGEIFLLQYLVEGWNKDVWEFEGYNNGTYEFRYFETVETLGETTDTDLAPLFTKVKIPAGLDNEHLAHLDDVKINIIAHAMQAEGFADADAAWAQWK